MRNLSRPAVFVFSFFVFLVIPLMIIQACSPPSVDIKANGSDGPITINYNTAANLTWTSENATTCTASLGWSGTKAVSGSETTGNLTSSKTYKITCTGVEGTVSDSVTVNVNAAPAPTVDIKANSSDGPITINYNTAATLTWTSTNATTCSASNDWSGTKVTSGSENTGSLTSTKTYVITCTGAGGWAIDTVTVNTAPAPTVDIKANGSDGPVTVNYNTSANLTWTSTNATTCSASNDWSGTKVTSGSENTGSLTSTKTYVITCTGAGGSVTDSVTVNVNPLPTLFVDLEAIPSSGNAPLLDVDLRATVSGTAIGSINYKFDCTNDGTWDYTFNSISDNPKTVVDACDYSSAGTYTAKVMAERDVAPVAYDTTTISVSSLPAPTVDIRANGSDGPVAVNYNTSATLTWTSTNATNCSASNDWSGTKATSGSESTGNLTSTKTYVITCTGSGGWAIDTVTVNVSSLPAPTVDIKANGSDGPINIGYNNSANLTWTSTNATTCTASGDWSGTKSLSGSENTGTLTASETYVIVCTGTGGTVSDSVTVTTSSQDVYVDIKANGSDGPITINYNTSATLTWNSSGANYCYASGAWSGTKSLSGSENTGNLTAAETYTITCTGSGGSASDSVVVNVTSQSINFTVDKKAKNVTQGQTLFYDTISAVPGDKISFEITLKNNENRTISGLIVKDSGVTAKIISHGNLKIDGVADSRDIESEVNLGDLTAGQSKIITFEAQLAAADKFVYGTTDLINTVIVYNVEKSWTDTAKVRVNRSGVGGTVTEVPTGVLDNVVLSLGITFIITYGLLFCFFLYQRVFVKAGYNLDLETKMVRMKSDMGRWLDVSNPLVTPEKSERELYRTISKIRKDEKK